MTTIAKLATTSVITAMIDALLNIVESFYGIELTKRKCGTEPGAVATGSKTLEVVISSAVPKSASRLSVGSGRYRSRF